MTGSFADPNARNNWRRHTRGVPDAPLAVLTQLQPFNQAKGTGKSADHHTLAVLTNLQNADKHRQLTFLGPVLKQTLVSLEGQQMGVVPGYHNGAEVHYSPYPVDVEVEGVVAIPFGLTRQEGYEYPLMFDLILDFVANEVLPALEPLVP
jgi:hypothetical protein